MSSSTTRMCRLRIMRSAVLKPKAWRPRMSSAATRNRPPTATEWRPALPTCRYRRTAAAGSQSGSSLAGTTRQRRCVMTGFTVELQQWKRIRTIQLFVSIRSADRSLDQPDSHFKPTPKGAFEFWRRHWQWLMTQMQEVVDAAKAMRARKGHRTVRITSGNERKTSKRGSPAPEKISPPSRHRRSRRRSATKAAPLPTTLLGATRPMRLIPMMTAGRAARVADVEKITAYQILAMRCRPDYVSASGITKMLTIYRGVPDHA